MRDMFFRGKRLDNKEWINESETYIHDGDGLWLADETTDVVKVDPATVGQYTGLKDKNDKEIYEGDIVSVSYGHPGLDSSGVIEHRCGGFILRYRDHGYLNPVDFSDCDIRILGNIHDNPELLKGSEDDA